jgi:hypothetical protein
VSKPIYALNDLVPEARRKLALACAYLGCTAKEFLANAIDHEVARRAIPQAIFQRPAPMAQAPLESQEIDEEAMVKALNAMAMREENPSE